MAVCHPCSDEPSSGPRSSVPVVPEKAGCAVPGSQACRAEVVAPEEGAADTHTAGDMPGNSWPTAEVAHIVDAGEARDSGPGEAAEVGPANRGLLPTLRWPVRYPG